MPQERELAPDFTLPDQDGNPVSLTDFRGRKVVLYFYPKDDTPGCTTQACDIRDRSTEFDARGTVVLGVSPDDEASHQRFRAKYDLNFPLLADTDHAVAEAYGVWQNKSMFGRKYWGNQRTTFLIDEEGRIARILPGVRAGKHAEQVLAFL
ncbi:MAG: thioredoxin-dependent thiol peroxidase [Gemmatimonadota bacterium]